MLLMMHTGAFANRAEVLGLVVRREVAHLGVKHVFTGPDFVQFAMNVDIDKSATSL